MNSDRLGGRDRAPADVACRTAAVDRDSSDVVEHPIEARQSAESHPPRGKIVHNVLRKRPVFSQRDEGSGSFFIQIGKDIRLSFPEHCREGRLYLGEMIDDTSVDITHSQKRARFGLGP